MQKQKLKTVISIDDSYSSQANLHIEVDNKLKRIIFMAIAQHGPSTFFQLYPSKIDELIEFLEKAKEKLCKNTKL